MALLAWYFRRAVELSEASGSITVTQAAFVKRSCVESARDSEVVS